MRKIMTTDATWKTVIRADLLRVVKEIDKLKLSPPMTGNFSFFDRKNNYVYITPSQINRKYLTSDDILVLSLSGEIIDNPNNRKASMELWMHINIYKTRHDIDTVFHVHKLNDRTNIISVDTVYGELPFCEPGSKDLSMMIIEPVKKHDLILLKEHGWVLVGAGLLNTFTKLKNIINT